MSGCHDTFTKNDKCFCLFCLNKRIEELETRLELVEKKSSHKCPRCENVMFIPNR